ncbi:MAG: type II secretion system protein GspG, partial [Acidobacteriota bacterium]
NERGAALIAVLIVLVLLAVGLYFIISRTANSSVGALANAGAQLDETKRQRTLSDMRAIADAIRLMQADTGRAPASLADLQHGGYLEVVPMNDAWGHGFIYAVDGNQFELTSLGSDGRAGPAPPQPWTGGSYPCDLTLTNGQFTQAPATR